jgi:TonB family protein
MSRRWLVGVSVVAHVAVGVGLVVSGVWRIDRLEAARMPVVLRTPLSPPEPAAGGPVAVKVPDVKPKMRKVIVKTPTQPDPETDEPPEVGRDDDDGDETAQPGDGPGKATDQGTCLENCGETPAPAPVCGDHVRALGEQCDDGNKTDGDGCSSACRTEVKAPGFVPPTVLNSLRTSGETQVHPSTSTQHQMMRNDDRDVRGVVKLCLSPDGGVASATMQRSTGYAEYDQTILSAVRRWRYRPYMVNNTPVAACSTVTFLYSIR